MRAALAVSLLAALPAFAGRPLSTEDADVLGDGRCQLEAWIDRSSGFAAGWLVPACNVGAGIEWQAGFGRERADGASSFSGAYLQAKAVIAPMSERSPWGWGIVAGVSRNPHAAVHRGWHNPYATIPVTIAWDETLLHVNAGWARDREARRDAATWGVAVEAALAARLTAVAEAFGVNSERPFLRVGARFEAVKEALSFDLTWVARPGGAREERYLSAGLAWQSERFLP